MENEGELLIQARSGDLPAVAALATAYGPEVYRLARYLMHSDEDARDAAAEIFVRLYSARDNIPVEGFKPWLMRVTYNYCLDVLRRKNTLRRLLPKIHQHMTRAVSPGPEQAAVEADERAEVRRAVAQLPETERMVVVLRYYHQLSYSEIGLVLDIPEATVGTRLYRAREKLRSMLSWQEGGVEGCDAPKTVFGGVTLIGSCRRLTEKSLKTTC